jgi:hypothetical protein
MQLVGYLMDSLGLDVDAATCQDPPQWSACDDALPLKPKGLKERDVQKQSL